MRERICISIESDSIQKIDNAKGKNEPRSRFIEDVLLEFLENKK